MKRILGLGVGYGEYLKQFKGKGVQLYGVDMDKDRLAEAKKLGIKTEYADLNAFLPSYPLKYFDLIVCNHVIEHMYDIGTMLMQSYTIIKPDGKLLINTPNLGAWHQILQLLLNLQPHYTKPRVHLKVYTYGFLKEILKTYNWQVVEHNTYPNRRGVWLLDILDWLFSCIGMGSNICVVCKKKG